MIARNSIKQNQYLTDPLLRLYIFWKANQSIEFFKHSDLVYVIGFILKFMQKNVCERLQAKHLFCIKLYYEARHEGQSNVCSGNT